MLHRIGAFIVLAMLCGIGSARAQTPVNIQLVGGPIFFVPVGRTLDNLQVRIVDATGQGVPGATAQVSYTCGHFYSWPGGPLVIQANANGLATFPTWYAPGNPDHCLFQLGVSDVNNPQLAFTVVVETAGPDLQTATAFVNPDNVSSYTVGSGSTFIGLRVVTLNAQGSPVPRQGVTWMATCGTFPGGGTTYAMMSDAAGIAMVPGWTAPAHGPCGVSANMSNVAPYVFTMSIYGDTAPPPAVATAIQRDSPATVSVPYNGTYSGFRVLTVDSSGNRAGNTAVIVDAACGAFGGQTRLSMTSDSTGALQLPTWTAPAVASTTSCFPNVQLWPINPLSAVPTMFEVDLTGAPTGATRISANGPLNLTTPAGGDITGVTFTTRDSANVPIAGDYRVTASCGTLEGGNLVLGSTTSGGIGTLPTWHAPSGTPGTCLITVAITAGATLQYTVTVTSPPQPPVLQRLEATDPYRVPVGAFLKDVHFATVDGAGARQGGQSVTATGSCGSFNGQASVTFTSDANGVATMPDWQAPNDFSFPACTISAVRPGGTPVVLNVQVQAPLPPDQLANQLVYVDVPGTYQVVQGQTLTGMRVATTISTPTVRIPNQAVTVQTNGCGSFSGQSSVSLMSDAGGVATFPPWTAPSTGTSCTIVAELTRTHFQLNITIALMAGSPPNPPPGASVGSGNPVTAVTGSSPAGGTIALSLASSNANCTLGQSTFMTQTSAPMPPDVAYPHGLIDFRTDNCGSGQAVTFNVDFPTDLPPTAQWWKYGPTMDNRTPHWYTIPSAVSGKRISFTITDGGLGDDDLMMNGSISDLGMLAVPNGLMQDLWWSGIGENGWGMTIAQHRDVLFANMFVYDANGAPTWYVMPSGSWNTAHTAYTGNLYLPKGSPFFAYDGTKFDIGAAVGTATLTFSDANNASFDYTISGITGHKNITRILFGPQSPPTDKPLGDLWWAGSQQSGWGIALMQQYSSLFGLWFTYDANGKATWYVMPSGTWVVTNDWQGKIYRADGPPWLGVSYDASRHKLTEVGTFRYRFSGDGATFDYTVDGKSGTIALTRIPF